MEINGRTRTCGLIGNPVEHTLSPVIHNTLAQRFGHNLVYVPFPVETGRIEEAVVGASALQLLGLNVTVPYKGEVISCLREVDSLAASIGAVNTLVATSTLFPSSRSARDLKAASWNRGRPHRSARPERSG